MPSHFLLHILWRRFFVAPFMHTKCCKLCSVNFVLHTLVCIFKFLSFFLFLDAIVVLHIWRGPKCVANLLLHISGCILYNIQKYVAYSVLHILCWTFLLHYLWWSFVLHIFCRIYFEASYVLFIYTATLNMHILWCIFWVAYAVQQFLAVHFVQNIFLHIFGIFGC